MQLAKIRYEEKKKKSWECVPLEIRVSTETGFFLLSQNGSWVYVHRLNEWNKTFSTISTGINYTQQKNNYDRGNWHVMADFSISSSGPLHIHHRWRSKKQDSRLENYRIKFKTNPLSLFRFHLSTLILFLSILIFYLLSLFN